jgi:hypothetical protein
MAIRKPIVKQTTALWKSSQVSSRFAFQIFAIRDRWVSS